MLFASALPWAGVPHRQHELALGLSDYFDLLYLEPPADDADQLYSVFPADPGNGPEFGLRNLPEQLRIVRTGARLPKWLWYLSARADKIRFRRALGELANTFQRLPRILWVDGGSSAPTMEVVPHDLLVYDCVDLDWTYSRVRIRRAALRRWHDLLLKRADIIFFSMRSLYEEQKQLRSNCFFVPNACSLAHFTNSPPCPVLLQMIKPPIIGFVGAMLEERFDSDLLAFAATKHQEWSFVLIGGADEQVRRQLAVIPNIHFLGRQPHGEMPVYLAHSDVLLIPNQTQSELRYCFPKKLYEYLAVGRPIVSTAIPEVSALDGLVKIARSPEEFVRKIEECLAENADPALSARLVAERQAVARENTWEKRVEQIVGILDTELLKRGYAGLR